MARDREATRTEFSSQEPGKEELSRVAVTQNRRSLQTLYPPPGRLYDSYEASEHFSLPHLDFFIHSERVYSQQPAKTYSVSILSPKILCQNDYEQNWALLR